MSAALIAVSTFLPTNMAGFLASIAIGGSVYAAVIFGLTGGRVFKDLGRILREGLRRGSGESNADAVTL
jgi:hypothetical protein